MTLADSTAAEIAALIALRARIDTLERLVSDLLTRRECPAWLLLLPEPASIPEGHTLAFVRHDLEEK